MNKQTYFLIDNVRRQNCTEFIRQLPTNPDTPLVVTIQERTRTLDQNAKLWACLNDVSEQVNWHGRKLTSEEWKHVFTAALKRQDVVPGIDGGFVVLGQSTSRMTVGEMRDLIELISAFGADHDVRFGDDASCAMRWAAHYGRAA
ncbi:recombination protein NinB [Erwinia sp. E602]|uniref:recombination protein NinB n=1 Tax=Erwinia sp. E602 TaxID=2675378 RepID=UPI001BAD9AD2|nr:recombination protein NinB [Erwinia sp. E602]